MQSLTVPQAPRSHPFRARCAASLARKSMLLLAFAGAAVTAAAQSVPPAPEKTSLIFLRAARLIDGRGGEAPGPAIGGVRGHQLAPHGPALSDTAGRRPVNLRLPQLRPGLHTLRLPITGL